MMRWIVWFSCWLQGCVLFAEVYPIGFSISETKVVEEIPEKTQDFAFIIPGNIETYIYDTESEYYQDYQRSYFAVTCKRGGWDCLRHYEILANGCIPYFVNLDQCDQNTLTFLPKDLISEAMHMEGVSYLHIDHSKFDRVKYQELLKEILAYTREHLTSTQMAAYLLEKVRYEGDLPILVLNGDLEPDYLRCCTLIGLKELLGNRVIDFPKIGHIYKGYPIPQALYGKGFSYTQIVDDLDLDREHIEERIKNREFGLIIYGSVHRGLPFYDLVSSVYEPKKIVYLCGEDIHSCPCLIYARSSPFFLREFERNETDPNFQALNTEYKRHCLEPSDINEHVPALRQLAKKSSSVIEIGVREMVSTWGLLQGLAENGQKHKSYTGIDLNYPPFQTLFLADNLAEANGIAFEFKQANDFGLEIEPADFLFIDSWHTYCHLTYELETFSPKIRKWIAMHDTSEPWGDRDEPFYQGYIPDYPSHIDINKMGLWPAVQDFLLHHPEWRLKERRFNNHGFTVLERIASIEPSF